MGYLGAAILTVAQLYDGEMAPWARFCAWAGFVFGGWWLAGRIAGLISPGPLTLQDFVLTLVWLSTTLWLLGGRRFDLACLGAFLYPPGFLLWAASLWAAQRVFASAPPTSIAISLMMSVIAASVFLLLAVFGIMYIEKERELAEKRIRLFYYQLPALDDMDDWMARLLLWGWLWFTATLMVGQVLWAGGHFSGGLGRLAPVGVWAIYAMVLAGRLFWHWRGHRVAVGAMLAFVGVLGNLFVVDLVLTSPHGLFLW